MAHPARAIDIDDADAGARTGVDAEDAGHGRRFVIRGGWLEEAVRDPRTRESRTGRILHHGPYAYTSAPSPALE